ncbi:MAG: hypothetical protein AAFX01_13200 [Cyanobacteria bacterium J06638_28]
MTSWIKVKGIVTVGHGVASGKSSSHRFPQGTIRMQAPFFAERGLSLKGYFMGTLNLSITPKEYQIKQPRFTFRDVKWSPDSPAEDFSFCDCRVVLDNQKVMNGLIYYPHPETKPEHFQDPDILEILVGFIESLSYGDELLIEVNEEQIAIV